MAKFTISPNMELYEKRLAKCGAAILGICKYSSYDAADMVINEIKKNCPVGDDTKRNNAHLRDSFKLSKFKSVNGFVRTKVVCEGYDDKGVPQALKARALESGATAHGKYAFIRKSVEAVQGRAIQSMEKNLNKKIDEIVNGG